MRKVVLFIAMSLDGYIADQNGGVDWLTGQNDGEETPDSYSAFIKDVDTVVMGWNTYYQIVAELSPGEWVYAGMTSYIVTHRDIPSTGEIKFTKKGPCELVNELRQEEGKSIWICGGADVIRQLIKADLIDEFDISIISTILGAGISLFGTNLKEIKLKLTRAQTQHGITELIYTRR